MSDSPRTAPPPPTAPAAGPMGRGPGPMGMMMPGQKPKLGNDLAAEASGR